MKEYQVSFYFDEEFRITFQHGPNEVIPFTEYNNSQNSKNAFFKKVEDGKNLFDPADSFFIRLATKNRLWKTIKSSRIESLDIINLVNPSVMALDYLQTLLFLIIHLRSHFF